MQVVIGAWVVFQLLVLAVGLLLGCVREVDLSPGLGRVNVEVCLVVGEICNALELDKLFPAERALWVLVGAGSEAVLAVGHLHLLTTNEKKEDSHIEPCLAGCREHGLAV